MMKHIFSKWWPIFVIGIVWFLFSSPYFLKGLVPFPSTYLATFFPPWNATYGMPVKNNAMPDTISQIYPWKKLTIDSWKSGTIPLWNPYSFSGTAHAANYQTAIFSPFNLLFLLLNQIDAWSIMILLQPILAGVFMYIFLRSLVRSKEASLIGGFAFMFCGFMVVWMAYGTLGYAALWLPIIFYGIHSGWKNPSLWKYSLVSIGIALSLLSGHFQISCYVCILSFIYVIYQTLVSKRYKTGAIYSVFFLLGILIALPQLLLTVDAYVQSVRSTSFVKGEIIPWQYLITLLAPDFYGNPVTRNDWFGHYAEWAGYIGVIPLFLAIFVMTKKEKREEWFYIVSSIIALLLALPTPFADALFRMRIPALSTSAASRIIILVSFSLAVLSAYGLDYLKELWKKSMMKQVIRYALFVCVIIGILWVYIVIGKPLPLDKLAIAKRNFILPSIVSIFVVLLFFAGFIKKCKISIIVPYILCLLVAVDVLRFAVKWMPFDPREYMYPKEKSLEFLESHVGNDRVFGNIGNEVASMFHIPVVEGYDAMYQGRYAEFINAVSKGSVAPGDRSVVQFDKNGKYKTEALQLLGIRYIYHRLSDGRHIWAFPYWEYPDNVMKQIYHDDKYWIYEYTDSFPRAYLVSGYKILTEKQEIISTLFSKHFDRRESVILEEKPLIEPQQGTGSAQIISYQPNIVTIQTESTVPKLLFLSDVYNSGWKVTVDGKPSRIYRADYDFRAVAVPKGTHIVRFQYAPGYLKWGLFLSGLSIVCIVGLVTKHIYEHRHL